MELHEMRETPSYWSGVFAMTLCVFALVASEFMPVSMLTPLAADLNVSEGAAGRGIAISGALAVLTSLSISRLARGMDRKTLLLLLTVLMGISGVVVATALNYTAYMFGRALLGIVIGGFWAMSAATAMRLVPTRDVPRALAVFNGGNALATVIAAPMGAYLGSIIGWRGTFWCLVPVAAVTVIWQWVSLPKMLPTQITESRGVFTLLRSRVVAFGMAASAALFMGQFALFTYVRPYLETVTHIDVSTLSLILLAMGITGLIGTMLIGKFLERGLYRALAAIPIAMAVMALLMIPLGGHVGLVATLLAMWGLLATAAPVAWWSWIAQVLPKDAEAGGGLMVAVVQLAIAMGSTIGGLLFDGSGYASTFILSAAVLFIGAFLTLCTARAEKNEAAWNDSKVRNTG